MSVKAVVRRDAYPNRLAARVGAETKTLKNCEASVAKQTAYLKNLMAGPKEVLGRLKKERDESKGRLANAEKALAAKS